MADAIAKRKPEDLKKEAEAKAEERRATWINWLERFLATACEAETKGDYVGAGRAFVIALLCEARSRPDGHRGWAYVFQAMPVY